VAKWLKDPYWAEANIALRADGTWISIDVDDYDEKTGAADIAALEEKYGVLPATITSTSRGADSPSRQHFYQVPPGLEFRSSLSDSVEVVQQAHRYAVVAPSVHPSGEFYAFYDVDGEEMWGFPSPSDFEMLPEAWLEYLTVDPAVTHEGFGGTVDDWLNTLPEGEPSHRVRHLITNLPTENFTHRDVISIIWRLVRLGAEGNAGIRWALETIEETWLSGDFDKAAYQKELSDAIVGAIKKGGALEVPELLEQDALRHVIAGSPGAGELIFGDVEPTAANRKKLIDELFASGASEEEVLSIVFRSKLNTADHQAELWPEVVGTVEPEPVFVNAAKVKLLTDAERERLKYVPNFIDMYIRVAKRRETNPNLPYHYANALTALALTFGEFGYIPKEPEMPLCVFQIIAGDTTSGKGIAKGLLKNYLADSSPFNDYNIGMPESKEALQRVLVERDGQMSWSHTDEAHGFLAKLRDKNGHMTGLQAAVTDYYEGEVGAFQKQSDRENSGKSARTVFNLWLMGTPQKIMDNLSVDQVEDGFLARFITAFGEPRHITEESLRPRQRAGAALTIGHDPYVRVFARDCGFIATSLAKREAVVASDAVIERMWANNLAMFRPYRDHRLAKLIEPATVRLMDNVWKVAALIGLSNGRHTIEMDDMLIAIRCAEHWLPNMVRMMEGVAANDWSQQKSKVLEFIVAKKTVKKSALARQFDSKMPGELANITGALVAEKRIHDNSKYDQWEALE